MFYQPLIQSGCGRPLIEITWSPATEELAGGEKMIGRAMGHIVCQDTPMAMPREEPPLSRLSVFLIFLVLAVEMAGLLILFLVSPA
jgi:hypothetical protein